jgi:hypothetical protein
VTVTTDDTANQPPAAFEEFKLYYESTERVTDRRLAMNRWNYSISVGIVLAIAAIVNWSAGERSFLFVGVCAVLLLSAMASLFCTFWLRQIADFKSLNNAKFAVLNEMARDVAFLGPDGNPVAARSYQPFDREWQMLSEDQSVKEVSAGRLRRIVALRSSGAELFIPKAFRLLFVVVFALTLADAVIDWTSISDQISPFNPQSSSNAPPSK